MYIFSTFLLFPLELSVYQRTEIPACLLQHRSHRMADGVQENFLSSVFEKNSQDKPVPKLLN